MTTQYFDQLQPKHDDNAVLMRSEYNAIVQAVLRGSRPAGAYSSNEYQQFGGFDKQYPVPYWFAAKSKTEMRTNSVCVIDITEMGTSSASTRVKGSIAVNVMEYDYNFARPMLFTNGTSSCSANGLCMIRAIDYLQPIVLWCKPGEIPTPGFPCGPISSSVDPDVDPSYGISKYGFGLVCLAADDDTDVYSALVILPQPGARWLVKPNEDIASGEKGDVKVYIGAPGEETVGVPEIELKNCFNRTSALCGADKFCEVVEIDGKPYIVPWECEAVEGGTPAFMSRFSNMKTLKRTTSVPTE